MKAKSKKDSGAVPLALEVSGADRAALSDAYKSGLILAWKRDLEHGYRLALAGRPDEYVEVAQLTKYLAKLRTS